MYLFISLFIYLFFIALFVILFPLLVGKGHKPVQMVGARVGYKVRQVN